MQDRLLNLIAVPCLLVLQAQPLATFANQEIVDLGAALPASAEPLPINRRTLGPWQNEGSNQAAWDYAHDVIAAEVSNHALRSVLASTCCSPVPFMDLWTYHGSASNAVS